MRKERVPELEKLEQIAAYLRGYIDGAKSRPENASIEAISETLKRVERKINYLRFKLSDPTLDEVSKSALAVATRCELIREILENTQSLFSVE